MDRVLWIPSHNHFSHPPRRFIFHLSPISLGFTQLKGSCWYTPGKFLSWFQHLSEWSSNSSQIFLWFRSISWCLLSSLSHYNFSQVIFAWIPSARWRKQGGLKIAFHFHRHPPTEQRILIVWGYDLSSVNVSKHHWRGQVPIFWYFWVLD